MPYFSEYLVRNGRLLTGAVINVDTGETIHEFEMRELPNTYTNYAVRALVTSAPAGASSDLAQLRTNVTPFAELDNEVLNLLRCPITMTLFENPVVASDGHTYERTAIEEWIRTAPRRISPLTREPISDVLVENHLMRQLVEEVIVARATAGAAELDRGMAGRTASDVIRSFLQDTRDSWREVFNIAALGAASSVASTVFVTTLQDGGGATSASTVSSAALTVLPSAIVGTGVGSLTDGTTSSGAASSLLFSGGRSSGATAGGGDFPPPKTQP